MSAAEIVSKVWNQVDPSGCNAQAEGVGYGAYVEQMEAALEEFCSVEEVLTAGMTDRKTWFKLRTPLQIE